jgi:hypothetical protein
MIRFDEEWFEVGNASPLELYMAALGLFHTPADHIRDAGLLAAHSRRSGLPTETVDRVLNGDPLSTIFRGLDDPLSTLLGAGTSRYGGGWLSPGTADELLSDLHRVEGAFTRPDEATVAEAAIACARDENAVRTDLADAYGSAVRYLTAASRLQPSEGMRCIAE